MTQLSDIRTAALDVFGYNANDPLLDSTTMNRLVNQALKQLSTEYDWPWLYAETTISIVAGTTDYAVPTRWSRTKWLFIDDNELKFRSPKQMQRLIGDNTNPITGQPLFYTTVGDTSIRVGRTPDAAYTADHAYYTYEATLTNDTDEPVLFEAYDDMLVMYVAKKLAMRKGEANDLNIARAEIQAWDKRVRDNVRRSSALPMMKHRQDWSTTI